MNDKIRNKIFISYSHKDQVWHDRLLIFLKPYKNKNLNLEIWSDSSIKVGDIWKRKIDQQLLQTKVGILLISPYFLASDFIMEYEVPQLEKAAKNGYVHLFCVPLSASPVKPTGLDQYQWARSPHEPLDILPEPERHVALVTIVNDLVEIFQESFLNQRINENQPKRNLIVDENKPQKIFTSPRNSLISHTSPHTCNDLLAKLFGVPAQRPHFHERLEELNQLKISLLHESITTIGITGESSKLGLHGQGGIGKTVLAIALANDTEVRRAFPDGIFWFTLGQESNLISIQKEWLIALGEKTPIITTITDGRNQLRAYLEELTCLLILDDIWEADHLEAFDVLGLTSRLLLTTRDATILTAIGAKECSLSVLAPHVAQQLLADWSGKTQKELTASAARILDFCKGIPLAIALAGAQLREGIDCEILLHAFETGDLEFLDHPYGSLFTSIKLSIQALPEIERRRYLELSIFPEDILIPITIIERLWQQTGNLTQLQSQKLLTSFARKNLIFKKEEKHFSDINIHDLQRDFMRLVAPRLDTIHQQFLQYYRKSLQQDIREKSKFSWSWLPNDEIYLWTYLSYHLTHGDLHDEQINTTKDLCFLGKKIWLLGANAIENDLQFAMQGIQDNSLLIRLEQIAIQNMHLLFKSTTIDGALVTWLSRTQEEKMLQTQIKQLEHSLVPPYLKATWPMPDLPDPALVKTLIGHRGPVLCCAIDPNGCYLVSGAEFDTFILWDLPTGKIVRTLDNDVAWGLCCTFDPKGRWVITGSGRKSLKMWDLTTGEVMRTFTGHIDSIKCCAIDPSGSFLISGSVDGSLIKWDLTTGKILCMLTGHTGEIECCTVDPTGRWLISGSWDSTLKVWDLASGRIIQTLKGHLDKVICCTIDPTGRWLISGSMDLKLIIWDLVSGSIVKILSGHRDYVTCCTVDSTSRWLISGDSHDQIKIWDLSSGELVKTLFSSTHSVTCCALEPTGKWLITGGAGDHALKVWNFSTEKDSNQTIVVPHSIRCCTTDSKSCWLITGHQNLGYKYHLLLIWDLVTREIKHTLVSHTHLVSCCVVDPSDWLLISGSWDNTLKVWDLATGKEIRTLRGHKYPITCCAVDPTGRWLISGSLDETLIVWELTTGKRVCTLIGSIGEILCCVVDPKGHYLIAGSEQGSLEIWNLKTKKSMKILKNPAGWITCCTVDPTGRWLVTGSIDQTLQMWDLTNGEIRCILKGHTGSIESCTLDSSGHWLISGDTDGGIFVWELSSGKFVTQLYVDGPVNNIIQIPNSFHYAVAGEKGIYQFELILEPGKH